MMMNKFPPILFLFQLSSVSHNFKISISFILIRYQRVVGRLEPLTLGCRSKCSTTSKQSNGAIITIHFLHNL
jgi:hypothetical protein